jgi:hypothetical protein
VVFEIDRALHGEPLTEVGMRLRSTALEPRKAADDLPLGGVLAGLCLLAAAGILWRLWLPMCARIGSIAAQLEEQATWRALMGPPAVAEPPHPAAVPPVFRWSHVVRALLLALLLPLLPLLLLPLLQ